MSMDEVLDVITSKLKLRKEEREISAYFLWRHGSLISYSVNDPKSYPDKAEAFPGIFKQENPQEDWRIIKARMAKYAEAKRQVRKNARN